MRRIWNLLTEYKNHKSIYDLFAKFKPRIDNFSDENKEFNLKTGDTILFLNGYDLPMITKIIGFDADGRAFMLWDCYWFPVNLHDRLIQKLNGNYEEKNNPVRKIHFGIES